MTDKRLSNRKLLRRRVKCGAINPTNRGFTFDITKGGIGIDTDKPLVPKSKIIADIFVGDEIYRIEGIVKWVSIGLYRTYSSMGIKITNNPINISGFYKELLSKDVYV